jgi:hypothetical protein
MNNITLVGNADERPLPLIVAEKWNFKLRVVIENDFYWYSVEDWLAGILKVNQEVASAIWAKRKRRANEKAYEMDFAPEVDVLYILFNIKLNMNEERFIEIRNYLLEHHRDALHLEKFEKTGWDKITEKNLQKTLETV